MKRQHYLEAAEDLRENLEQWGAYESTGNCIILAGPGSGKTKTITVKIARLLAEDVKRPRRLACITYSNACVGELRSRLTRLGVEESARLLISTVHSFCLSELVVPFAQLAGVDVPNPLKVASPAQSADLFKRACIEVTGAAQKGWFKTACDKLRRTVPDRDSAAWKSANTRQTAVIDAYEKKLRENEMLDFDGLVLTGLHLIEKHVWIRASIKAKYPVIVIDEYQDLGVPLHRMVVCLMQKAGVRIIAVGDPDQSIYGFTGAKPALLKTFHSMGSTVKVIRLRLNYRCADLIIEASKTLLEEPPDFQAYDSRDGELLIHRVGEDVQGQAKYILETLVPRILSKNKSWKLGDIAILYRSLREGASIAAAADALGIKYFRSDNGAPIKRSRMIDWLSELARWCSGGWKNGDVSLSQVLRTWRLMRRSVAHESELLSLRAVMIRTLFELRDGSMSLNKWLTCLKDNVLEEMFENEPGLSDERDSIEEMIRLTKKNEVLSAFTVQVFGGRGRSHDQINFLTLHSSKGLEFEVVFIVNLESGEFPSDMDRDDEQLSEASRLFYVGITRAKNQVHLTHATTESPFIAKIREASGPEPVSDPDEDDWSV